MSYTHTFESMRNKSMFKNIEQRHDLIYNVIEFLKLREKETNEYATDSFQALK